MFPLIFYLLHIYDDIIIFLYFWVVYMQFSFLYMLHCLHCIVFSHIITDFDDFVHVTVN